MGLGNCPSGITVGVKERHINLYGTSARKNTGVMALRRQQTKGKALTSVGNGIEFITINFHPSLPYHL